MRFGDDAAFISNTAAHSFIYFFLFILSNREKNKMKQDEMPIGGIGIKFMCKTNIEKEKRKKCLFFFLCSKRMFDSISY